GCLVLPIEEPQAYVLGILKPRVYVSQGLLEQANEDDLASVLAHERAHAARRDPLRRLIASLGLVLHLPGIAHLLGRLLTRTQEMAADADAARVVGDRVRVAESLVRFARLRGPSRAVAVEFGSGDLEARVKELLDTHQRRGGLPSAAVLVGCAPALSFLPPFPARGFPFLAQALLRLPGPGEGWRGAYLGEGARKTPISSGIFTAVKNQDLMRRCGPPSGGVR